MQIYLICTGNTCRSPMAEAILKNKNLQDIQVFSAGVYSYGGEGMSQNAQAVLNQHGIEHCHTSSPVEPDKIASSDLILTMTNAHLQALLQFYPQAADKAFTLSEYVMDSKKDVSDPFGGDLYTYEATFEELQRLIDALQSKIVEE